MQDSPTNIWSTIFCSILFTAEVYHAISHFLVLSGWRLLPRKGKLHQLFSDKRNLLVKEKVQLEIFHLHRFGSSPVLFPGRYYNSVYSHFVVRSLVMVVMRFANAAAFFLFPDMG